MTAIQMIRNAAGALLLFTLLIAAPLSASVNLPVEVLGPDGYSKTVSVTVPGAIAPGPVRLYLQVHGLEYETQASVRVNSGSAIAINSFNVILTGLGQNYGGIGGGFHTLTMTVALPVNAVVQGANTVTFQFLGTDGISSGFSCARSGLLGQ